MTDQPTKVPKKPKGRSPSYPAIDLEEAIQKAGLLYKAEGQHPASIDVVVRDWGYKSLNGPPALAIAALKRFGLTDDEGIGPARRIRVSDLAVNILENPVAAERREAIETAALNPPIHREMWNKYGQQLPSQDNIKWFLTRERGFTDTGAKEFISEYKTTIAYAHLFGAGNLGAQTTDEDDGSEVHEQDESPRAPRRPQGGRMSVTAETDTYFVPIAAGVKVAVEGPFPLTENQWTQFQAVLNAMKPALVRDEPLTADGVEPEE